MSRLVKLLVAVLGLAVLAETADAGPATLASAANAIRLESAANSAAEPVTWRGCVRHRHHRHCYWRAPRVYSFYYRQPRVYSYRYYAPRPHYIRRYASPRGWF